MRFGLFKRKDLVCGMTEVKEKGLERDGLWFCSDNCAEKYNREMKMVRKRKGNCCY